MDTMGLGRAMGNALAGLVVIALLGGMLVGGCGVCVAQKVAGYRIHIERAGPAGRADGKGTP